MPVAIPNYRYSYRRKGKPVYVPTSIGRRIGNEIKEAVEEAYDFSPTYFHMASGGHVAAMHHHRDSAVFARIDIARFFYSVSRRRVQSAIDRIGLKTSRFYAQWSTVRNPYGEPDYALPYGFVQSPILASLTIATSSLGEHLEALPEGIRASVYMDDIALSGDDPSELEAVFRDTLGVLEREGFAVNEEKLRPPSRLMDIFNCDLSSGRSVVRAERIEEFLSDGPSEESERAFTAYCASVEDGNAPPAPGVTQNVTQNNTGPH